MSSGTDITSIKMATETKQGFMSYVSCLFVWVVHALGFWLVKELQPGVFSLSRYTPLKGIGIQNRVER